jgi:hypothetical protein
MRKESEIAILHAYATYLWCQDKGPEEGRKLAARLAEVLGWVQGESIEPLEKMFHLATKTIAKEFPNLSEEEKCTAAKSILKQVRIDWNKRQ